MTRMKRDQTYAMPTRSRLVLVLSQSAVLLQLEKESVVEGLKSSFYFKYSKQEKNGLKMAERHSLANTSMITHFHWKDN